MHRLPSVAAGDLGTGIAAVYPVRDSQDMLYATLPVPAVGVPKTLPFHDPAEMALLATPLVELLAPLYRRTSMRRHCLSRPTWRPSTWPSATAPRLSRYASIRTFGEPTPR